MATTFEFTIEGHEALLLKLNRAAEKLGNMSSLFVEIGHFLTGFYSTFPFVTQGGIYGERWAPLADSTLKSKAKHYAGRSLLVASGAMQHGFEAQPGESEVRVTNPVSYFKYHQLGTRKMPQRLVMAIEDRQEQRVNEIFKNWIDEAL